LKLSGSSSGSASATPIRVLVVEESSTVRQLLVAILKSDPEISVVGEAGTGAEAVRMATELAPDLITMDVNMPLLDGIDATKEIMREAPTRILLVTSLAPTDVNLSLSAMEAGALMVVAKPESPTSPDFESRRKQLLDMTKAMASVKVVRRWSSDNGVRSIVERQARRLERTEGIRLVAIGTSTGGPAALHRVLVSLPPDFPAPVLVVQHIAQGFVAGLASWLGSNCALQVTVAAHLEKLSAGTVYLAPDGAHLGVTRDSRALLSDASPIGGFRPSADFLFDSAADAFGSGLLALILTGMGRDGVEGLRSVVAHGGKTLAQDETSSVVYGMAAEAVRAGVVSEILPLERIGPRVLELVTTP
jgi:two-component system, chemotaxis family, protein-glutamate methylesterase/glutaminase